MQRETFAPILFVLKYTDFEDAMRCRTACRRAYLPPIFTLNLREAERFLAADGSDCGIANVNSGPSGAEIGGAFGGEKETGGGREAGFRCLEELHAARDQFHQLRQTHFPWRKEFDSTSHD